MKPLPTGAGRPLWHVKLKKSNTAYYQNGSFIVDLRFRPCDKKLVACPRNL